MRRGAIVVYPIYRQDTAPADVATTMRAALAELAGAGHVRPDPTRTAVVGFSAGGPVAANYAAAATTAGLPVPGALFVYRPRIDAAAMDREPPPPATQALVLVGDHDPASWMRGADAIWEWLAPLPAGQWDYVSLVSDDHGQPALSADHYVPLTTTRPDTRPCSYPLVDALAGRLS